MRAATTAQNIRNSKLSKNNTTGIVGVGLSPTGKFIAKITVNRQRINLGHFDTIEQAIEARRQGEIKYFGEFAHDANARQRVIEPTLADNSKNAPDEASTASSCCASGKASNSLK